MSFWKSLAKIGAGVAAPFTGGASLMAIPAIDAIGAGASGAANSMASNRGAKAAGQIDYDKNVLSQEELFLRALLERDKNARASRGDAWRDANRAEYMGKGGRETLGLNRLLSKPRTAAEIRPSEGQLFAADRLRAEAMDRLVHGDPVTRQAGPVQRAPITSREQFEKNLKPSFWEKLLGIGGAAAGIYGAASGGHPATSGSNFQLPDDDYLDPQYPWGQ